MKSILVSGGNSGIGLQAAREFVAQGHRVAILGRDRHKGEQAVRPLGGRATFHSVDLSTHDGVRDAAKRVLDEHEHLDAVLHTTGVMTFEDVRTADGLNLFFAVNYLSRYHLTQLLLPALRRAERARVVMMTAHVSLATTIDLQVFPGFESFHFGRMREQVQIGNHHYAAYLARTEPGLLAGVVNAGGAKTDIFRMQPWYFRLLATAVIPAFYGSVTKAAHNAVHASVRDDWPAATYWEKPGNFDRRTSIALDESTTHHVMDVSRKLTGA
ncbi:NAD(P)-dependent dehydrogenase (short-subunit alcohol dehydrogenase family) [Kibdelosporangium banguiense]|uniref:NAD(P)-dependent dehydrogenase (Short-subunit alcohol dehydrogenase family) n=1 Tax=Kibdelosporangium banguiense TaxID=1365924 RepID=A0ABS4TJ70_9PSEU|nr:SDR family NAD(P)-dependent oxidoreductase [Kibdelosporangium banguiense]MBP2324457.1 NAD(P)-dependent dehydrogenase (short-subunit alcohol dehydrogenase family) [Kibdelosporangium banguiense]